MGEQMKGLQKRFQSEMDKSKQVQKEMQKSMEAREKLEAQLQENKLVKEELDLLEPDAVVHKLIGPALVKQELEEAKQNVAKRLDYINGEIRRLENQRKDLEKKQDGHRENLTKIHQQLQQLQVRSAAKS